jgi:hypothetical protein
MLCGYRLCSIYSYEPSFQSKRHRLKSGLHGLPSDPNSTLDPNGLETMLITPVAQLDERLPSWNRGDGRYRSHLERITGLQRTSKGAEHSTGRCGDRVIYRGCVGFLNKRWINLVMLGDGAMDAEEDGLRFAGKVGDSAQESVSTSSASGRIGVSLPISLGWLYFASPSTARRLALHSRGNSLPIEFIIMQDPLQRHVLHEVANAIVTGLI